MGVRHVAVTVPTSAGAGVVDSPSISGLLDRVVYVPDATTPYDTGVDLTSIVNLSTGETLLAKSNLGTALVAFPVRQAVVGADGVASLYAAGGAAVLDRVAVRGRMRITLAQAGSGVKTGSFVFVLLDD